MEPLDEQLSIAGGRPLDGDILIAGAKNAGLPILASTLLCDRPVTICNLPHLHDITTMLQLLSCMGVATTVDESFDIEVRNDGIHSFVAPEELVVTMRASILVLGPLLARFHQARVSFPGGCEIGNRPVDLHLRGLRALGAEIEVRDGYIEARSNGRLRGAEVDFGAVTVGGTANVLMASVLAEGETVIRNAAREPEVVDLARCLCAFGARITGIGETTLRVQGVPRLGGGRYTIMPDRVESGTYLAAVAASSGRVLLKNSCPSALGAVLNRLRAAGADITLGADWVSLDMHGRRPLAVDVLTQPYPGFPTDMQAQFTALNSVAVGRGRVEETIFDNRMIQVRELQRMGAQISLDGNVATVQGSDRLHGALVTANDLRASASLVIAGLVAEGATTIVSIHHIDRGYECIEEKLQRLGADIQRRFVSKVA